MLAIPSDYVNKPDPEVYFSFQDYAHFLTDLGNPSNQVTELRNAPEILVGSAWQDTFQIVG